MVKSMSRPKFLRGILFLCGCIGVIAGCEPEVRKTYNCGAGDISYSAIKSHIVNDVYPYFSEMHKTGEFVLERSKLAEHEEFLKEAKTYLSYCRGFYKDKEGIEDPRRLTSDLFAAHSSMQHLQEKAEDERDKEFFVSAILIHLERWI